MAKKIQLQIETPCHENWDNMTPADKGKFCASCQKHVIDFTRMTDREIALFFKKKSTDDVCGRLTDDQMNRDIEIPKKRIPWVRYFFQIALPALIFSAKASAQRVSVKRTVTVVPKTKVKMTESPMINKVTVADSLPTLKINPGNFQRAVPPVSSWVCIRAGGISVRRSYTTVNVKNKPAEKKKSVKETITPAVSKITLYPNPLHAGSALNIQWDKKETGDHLLQVFNTGGALVYQKNLYIDSETKSLNIDTQTLTAGIYFIKITGNKNSYTDKLIIE